MTTLQEYSIPVHKSLQQPDLLLGVPKVIVALIFCVTVLLIYLFGLGFAAVAVVLYVPCAAAVHTREEHVLRIDGLILGAHHEV